MEDRTITITIIILGIKIIRMVNSMGEEDTKEINLDKVIITPHRIRRTVDDLDQASNNNNNNNHNISLHNSHTIHQINIIPGIIIITIMITINKTIAEEGIPSSKDNQLWT